MNKIKKSICFPKNCRTEGTTLGHPVFKSEAYLRLVSIPPGDESCGSEKACWDSAYENSKAW